MHHSHIDEAEFLKHKKLKILLENDEAGVSMLRDKQDIFILGHLGYFKETLKLEYKRDARKVEAPKNYFDERGEIKYSKHSNANTIFSNWSNYGVYQSTPYVL